MDYTVFDNLRVRGKLDPQGGMDMDADDYTAVKPDATAAASTAPTKAEFDAVVELVNELKGVHNDLAAALAGE